MRARAINGIRIPPQCFELCFHLTMLSHCSKPRRIAQQLLNATVTHSSSSAASTAPGLGVSTQPATQLELDTTAALGGFALLLTIEVRIFGRESTNPPFDRSLMKP